VDGSCNHLRSFVKQIEAATGAVYDPVLLPQAAYDTILLATNGQRTAQRQGQAGLQSLQTASELTAVAVDQLYAEYGLRSGR
jgi:hypothetical protein